MIAQIEGRLIEIDEKSALVQVGPVAYEVLLPVFAVARLGDKIGQDILLYTMEYYEAGPSGGNIIPRLVGFLNRAERAFFEKFTSVKGMGIRKGLRSLIVPVGQIAAAIEAGSEKDLIALPQVGKRLAGHIVAELQGKVADFALEPAQVQGAGISREQTDFEQFQKEALEILIAWGEKRNEAMELIQRVCQKHPDVQSAEDVVPLVYRMKQGIEV